MILTIFVIKHKDIDKYTELKNLYDSNLKNDKEKFPEDLDNINVTVEDLGYKVTNRKTDIGHDEDLEYIIKAKIIDSEYKKDEVILIKYDCTVNWRKTPNGNEIIDKRPVSLDLYYTPSKMIGTQIKIQRKADKWEFNNEM